MEASKYSYSDLINILEGMYDTDKIKTQDSINWGRLEIEGTENIIHKLFELQNDTQRNGFLNTIFRRLFDNGKDYNLGLINHAGSHKYSSETGFDSDEYRYIENCKCVLNGLIWEVSEACIIYEGVDFEDVMKNSIRSANPYDYVFCIRGSENSISGRENMNRKKTTNYEIKDYDQIKAIFNMCNNEFFESEFITFRESIENADFSSVIIKRQTITQDLIYRLSGLFGKEWLNKVEDAMRWKRGVCGGRYSKVREYKEIKRLDKLISRPTKKTD